VLIGGSARGVCRESYEIVTPYTAEEIPRLVRGYVNARFGLESGVVFLSGCGERVCLICQETSKEERASHVEDIAYDLVFNEVLLSGATLESGEHYSEHV
jgi:hypothetical protein